MGGKDSLNEFALGGVVKMEIEAFDRAPSGFEFAAQFDVEFSVAGKAFVFIACFFPGFSVRIGGRL